MPEERGSFLSLCECSVCIIMDERLRCTPAPGRKMCPWCALDGGYAAQNPRIEEVK